MERSFNIEDMTIKQARELIAMFGTPATQEPASPHIGKKCIIRTYASGVHFGTLQGVYGRTVELKNARRLWGWDVAPHGVSLSEVSVHGPVGPKTKICTQVDEVTILDGLEIIPCTSAAVRVIEDAKVHKP